MKIRFIHQVLIDARVHGVGDVVEFPDGEALALIARGVAVAAPDVREAVQARPETRRAVKPRGA